MKTFKLMINKENMLRYLRCNGYMPSIKRAKFLQKCNPRSWELTWKEPKGEHKAVITFTAGKVGICIEHGGGHSYRTISPVELRRYGMVREQPDTVPQ